MGWKQSKTPFILNNPEKYAGDLNKLLYKSSWEENMFNFCDNNINIVRWGYEIIEISYMKPVEKGFKPSKYYPDLYVEYFDKDKNFIREVLEVKPLKQTKTSRSKKPLIKLAENYVVKVNHAKWDAAQKWCLDRGIKFSVITEKSIFSRKIK